MEERDKAIYAVDVLNDLIGDFSSSSRVLISFNMAFKSNQIDEVDMVAIQKMCLSHAILGISKWLEFYKKFSEIIPDHQHEQIEKLNNIIKERKIIEFRNKCVGHIWDNKLDRPLILSEIMERLEKITDGSLGNFISWINTEDNNYPETITSIILELLRHIMIKYEIKPGEFLER